MTNKEFVIETLRRIGREKAQAVRTGAAAGTLTSTEVIDAEMFVPAWLPTTDYTKAAAGTPVQYEGQVYSLLQPHNASYYPGTNPKTLPALWRVTHTKDPVKAKPWVAPTGTSDMYLVGECMVWTDGKTYRSKRDTVYSPTDYAPDWGVVG